MNMKEFKDVLEIIEERNKQIFLLININKMQRDLIRLFSSSSTDPRLQLLSKDHLAKYPEYY
jgi:hypothetical protein